MGQRRRDFLRVSSLGFVSGVLFRPGVSQVTEPVFKGKRVIDVHSHVNFHGHNVHRIVRNMNAVGIDVAWLLTWESPAEEIPPWDHQFLSPNGLGIPFEEALHAVELYPTRFVLGWAIDPRVPAAQDRLKAAVQTFKVRVYGELKLRMTYDNPDLIEMYGLCGQLGLPVLFHLEVMFPDSTGRLSVDLRTQHKKYWWGGDIDVIERVLQRCPRTNFIGHAPGFWREISGGTAAAMEMYPSGPITPGGKLQTLLDKYPNLYCDISANSGLNALKRDTSYTRRFLNTYQDRILFGRDGFDDQHLQFLNALNLPDEVLDKILSRNALKLVPIQ